MKYLLTISLFLSFSLSALLAQRTSTIFDNGVEKFKTGYFKEAIEDFTTVVERNEQYFEAYYLRARCYVALDNHIEALKDFGKAIDMNNELYVAFYYRGELYMKQNEYEKAIKDFTTAISFFDLYTSAYFLRAKAYEQSKKTIDKAIADYTTAIEQNDQLKEAWFCRGKLYIKKELYDEAVSDLDEAITIDSIYANAYYYRAIGHDELGHLRDATADYRDALRLGVNNEDIYTRYAYMMYQRYKFKKAIKAYDVLVKEYKSKNWEDYFNRGICHLRLHNYRNAEDDFSLAINYNKKNPDAFLQRGIAYFKLGNEAGAFRDFRRAIELRPDYFRPYEQRGLIYWEQERYDLALADFNKSIELRPTGDALYYRGAIRYMNGDKVAGCDDLRAAAELGQPNAVLDLRDICE